MLVGVKEHDRSERKCWARDLFVGKSWSHEGHVMPGVNSGILLLIGTFAELREMYCCWGLSGAGTFAKIMRDVLLLRGGAGGGGRGAGSGLGANRHDQ